MERVETGGIAERLVEVMVGFFGIGGLKEETNQLEAQLFSLEGAFSGIPFNVLLTCLFCSGYAVSCFVHFSTSGISIHILFLAHIFRFALDNWSKWLWDVKSSPIVQKMTTESHGKILGERPPERGSRNATSSVDSTNKWPWALTLKFHGGLGSMQSICMSNNANTTVAFGSIGGDGLVILSLQFKYSLFVEFEGYISIGEFIIHEVESWSISGHEDGSPLIWESQVAIIEKLISTLGIDRVVAVLLRILGLSNNFSGCSTPAPTVPSTQNGEDVNSNKTFLNAKQGFLSLLCKPKDPFSVKPLGRCLEYACESDSLLVMPNKLLRGHPVSNVGDLSIQASQSLGLLLNQLRSILVLCHQTLLIQGINLPLTYRTAKEPPSETRARKKRKFRSGGHRASVPEMKDTVHAAHEHATTSHYSLIYLRKASKVVKEGEKGRVLRLGNEWPRNMNVMANGWGSREESRLAHRRVPTTPKPEENSPPLSAIDQSDYQTVDAKALAFPGNPEQITGSKRVHRKAGESSIGGRDQLEGV
ncbi:hypothetical protein CK203_037499 [Vitis vinifera]|uniref:Uncharacterized protein n=1 Tax=Vitis vinifera TaxID=29760 RepID=A0A438HMB8_VITVI|nr:hypothetical protein CK203_037499 [Vitis vinifera]